MPAKELESVKGLQGFWHATFGDWFDKATLATLCHKGISPNYRTTNTRMVNCPKCRELLKNSKVVAGAK